MKTPPAATYYELLTVAAVDTDITTAITINQYSRKCTTYPDSIVKDLDLEPNEIQQLMKNKTTWRKFVSDASTIPSEHQPLKCIV